MKKIYAPIDNKNLMEDPFEDDVFRDFYAAPDHRKNGKRHLVGSVKTENYDAYVDVAWNYGDASITITLLAYNPFENLEDVRNEIFEHYKKEFKSWECEENEGLVVEFYQLNDKLNVIFYFVCE